MESSTLMCLLIPDGKIKEAAEISGLSQSLIYQERRPRGNAAHHTGTRNTIDRLDLFCTLALSHYPEAVRLIAKRYRTMYDNALGTAVPVNPTPYNLLDALAAANKEIGEAMSALGQRQRVQDCEVEVAQAKQALEFVLEILRHLEGMQNA